MKKGQLIPGLSSVDNTGIGTENPTGTDFIFSLLCLSPPFFFLPLLFSLPYFNTLPLLLYTYLFPWKKL